MEIVFLFAKRSKLQFSAAAAKISLVDSSVQNFLWKQQEMDEKCKRDVKGKSQCVFLLRTWSSRRGSRRRSCSPTSRFSFLLLSSSASNAQRHPLHSLFPPFGALPMSINIVTSNPQPHRYHCQSSSSLAFLIILDPSPSNLILDRSRANSNSKH